LYDARRGNVYLGGMNKQGIKIIPERIAFTRENIEKKVKPPYCLITPNANELVCFKHKDESMKLITFSGSSEYTGLLGVHIFRTNDVDNNAALTPAYLINNYI